MARSRSRGTIVLATVVVLMLQAALAASGPDPAPDGPAMTHEPTHIPMGLPGFLENGGQVDDPEVRFYAWSPRGGIALLQDGAMMTVVDEAGGKGCNVRLTLEGARTVEPLGDIALPGTTNFLRGNDPGMWRTGLATYSKVVYPGAWEGVDVVWSLDGGQPKYEFHLAPGADPSAVRIQVSGHDALMVDPRGDLLIGTPVGTVRDAGLEAFYSDGPREPIRCSFELEGDDLIAFDLEDADDSRPIVIDPLVYSTFVGGGNGEIETVVGVKADASGRALVVGYSNTTDFPTTTGAFQMTASGGDSDMFVFRLDANGTELEWSTYLGGTGADFAYDMDLDFHGLPVVVGRTNSTDFPTTTGAMDRTHSGSDNESFVLKMTSDGASLSFSTYMGGSDYDEANAVRAFGSGPVYVFGSTRSTDLPSTDGALQANHSGGGFDTFVARLRSDGSGLDYLTYLGGGSWDVAGGIDVNSTGWAYVGGRTLSRDFPVTDGCFQNVTGGSWDGYVAKLSPAGTALGYCTLVGGGWEDMVTHVAAHNDDGTVTVAGYTGSPLFPTTNKTYQTRHMGDTDIFVLGLNTHGSALRFSTLLGGVGSEYVSGLEVMADGTTFVSGRTSSILFNTTQGAYQNKSAGGVDSFISRLEDDARVLAYSTMLGGSDTDASYGLDMVGTDDAYITGSTDSDDFPITAGCYQPLNGGRYDVFVTRMDVFLDREAPVAVPGLDVDVDQHTTVAFNGSGSTDNVGVVNWSWEFHYDEQLITMYGPTFEWTFDLAGIYYVYLTVGDAVGLQHTEWAVVNIRDIEPPVAVVPRDVVGRQHQTIILDGESSHDNVEIVEWVWTFEYNGTPRELRGPKVPFHFVEAGIYTVNLTVTDAAGNRDNASFTIWITDVTDPVADVGEDRVIDQHQTVVLNATGSADNVDITNFTWQFVYGGVPITLYGEEVTFTFDRAGTYSVSMMVEDEAGNRATDTMRVTVRDITPPTAVAGPDRTIDQNEIADLDGSGSTDDVEIAMWLWNLTSGNWSRDFVGSRNTVQLTVAGEYLVTLSVADTAGNWANDSFVVTVRDIEPPLANGGKDIYAAVGEVVVLDGTASSDNVGIVSWSWAFKDRGQQVFLSGRAPNHTFSMVGTYVVTLTVTDSAGLTDMVQMNIIIEDSVLPVAEPGGPYSVMQGERLILDGTASTDNVEIDIFLWTFNYKMEPVVLEGSQPAFTFDIPGTYTITLTVSDSSGNNQTAETKVTVNSEGGGGNGGGTDTGGLGSLVLYIALAVIVLVIVVVLVMRRSRAGTRASKDMGWAPSEKEKKEREKGPKDEASGPEVKVEAEKGE